MDKTQKLVYDYIEYISKKDNLFDKNYATNTVILYSNMVYWFYQHVEHNNLDIFSIDTSLAKQIVEHISKSKNYSKNSSIKLIQAINSFYKYLISIELLTINPFKITISKRKNENLKLLDSKILKQQDIKLILENTKVDSKNYNAIILMLCFGLRISELNAINKMSFKFDEFIKLKILDSKSSDFRLTYNIFKMYDDIIKNIVKDCDFVFNTKSIQIYINRLSDKLSIKFSAHSFRHTYATEFLNKGGDLETLKEILGHTSIITTQIYGKITGERINSKIKTMNI